MNSSDGFNHRFNEEWGHLIYAQSINIRNSGFLAQLVDGSLGMGFGASSSSILLTYGIAPAVVSATVHSQKLLPLQLLVHLIGNLKMFISQRC